MKTFVTIGALLAAASVASADTLNLGTGTNAGTRGILFDLTNNSSNQVQIDSFDIFVWYGSSAPPSYTLPFEVYYVAGGWDGHQGLIGDWTLMGTDSFTVTGPTGTPYNVNIGGLVMEPGETYGIGFVVTNGVSSASAALQSHNEGITGQTFSDANLTATAGSVVINAASLSITTHTSNHLKSMVSGNINYTVVGGGCYADCDESESLDLFDILCFLNEFNANNVEYGDCDESESLDLFDILCFLNEFNAGC